MALSQKNVQKACRILLQVNPNAKPHISIEPLDEMAQNAVLGTGLKLDGGLESVYMNIQDITPQQEDLFIEKKGEISNTSFTKQLPGNITRIGWF